MTDSEQHVSWFRGAAAYINAHRGKTFVVYLEDDADVDALAALVLDLNLLHSLGVQIVLVPGARSRIDAALATAGNDSRFHDGRRVTTAADMARVAETAAALGSRIEALFTLGLSGSAMHLADVRVVRGNFVIAKPLGVCEGVDFQFSGTVRRIRCDAIRAQLALGNLVQLSCLGYSLTGETFNLSALEVAFEAAIELDADKLILLSKSGGIKTDGELLTSLDLDSAVAELERLNKDFGSESVQARQLAAAVRAYRGGVPRTHLISSLDQNALLQELFTRDGKGTLLSQDSRDSLRPASSGDVANILALIKPLEEQGVLVPRSRERLEGEIENFEVIELEETLIACGALYPIDANCAELACIATHPDYRKSGLGDRLLSSLEGRARSAGFTELFVLTTAAEHWFAERGFSEKPLDALPEPRRSLYNFQRNSKVLSKQLG